jgi:hypothetical protein
MNIVISVKNGYNDWVMEAGKIIKIEVSFEFEETKYLLRYTCMYFEPQNRITFVYKLYIDGEETNWIYRQTYMDNEDRNIDSFVPSCDFHAWLEQLMSLYLFAKSTYSLTDVNKGHINSIINQLKHHKMNNINCELRHHLFMARGI